MIIFHVFYSVWGVKRQLHWISSILFDFVRLYWFDWFENRTHSKIGVRFCSIGVRLGSIGFLFGFVRLDRSGIYSEREKSASWKRHCATHWREQRSMVGTWGLVIFDWFVLSMRTQVILDSTELQNNCACVTYDPVGARRRENLDLSNTFLMKDQS